jgi:hypothetical protein
MALKYLSHIETLNINMQKNVLSNVVIHPLTTATRPSSPIAGQIIYNDTAKVLEIWDGSGWVSGSSSTSITSVSAGTGLTGGGSSGSVSIAVDYTGAANIILAAGAISGAISTADFILVSDTSVGNAVKAPISSLPFTNNAGTVTSIAVSGNDGINVSGSPITSSGTVTLGLTNGSITNAKLANSSTTIGTTVISLGAASTSLSGLTSLDFAAGPRTIGASIGTNVLTLGAATSTVVIAGNLTVSGTTTTVNTETILLADNIITINSNATGVATQDGGIEIERGTDLNVTLLWDELANRWTVGTESFVAGTFIGDLSGNATTVTNGVYTTGSYADPAFITSLNWTKITNKPDPVITVTLTGDVTGTGNTTLTDLANGTISFATTIAANSVVLGTDTTGDYVAGVTVTASTGLSVTGTGESANVVIAGIDASTTVKGVVELATSAEAIAGTDTIRAVTSEAAAALVDNKIDAERFWIAIGDGIALTIPVTHGLNSDYVMVQCFEASTGQLVMVDITKTNVNTMTFNFAVAPTTGNILVSFIRIK